MLRLILIAAFAATTLTACASPLSYDATAADREYWDKRSQVIRTRYKTRD